MFLIMKYRPGLVWNRAPGNIIENVELSMLLESHSFPEALIVLSQWRYLI